MISCPNCGKKISEDAAHCGHCGHRIEVKQKKTMVGMGAIDQDELRAKLKKNKKAAQADDSSPVGGDVSGESDALPPDLAATTMMDEFELPTPGDGEAAADEQGASANFGTAPTAKMDKLEKPSPGPTDTASKGAPGAATQESGNAVVTASSATDEVDPVFDTTSDDEEPDPAESFIASQSTSDSFGSDSSFEADTSFGDDSSFGSDSSSETDPLATDFSSTGESPAAVDTSGEESGEAGAEQVEEPESEASALGEEPEQAGPEQDEEPESGVDMPGEKPGQPGSGQEQDPESSVDAPGEAESEQDEVPSEAEASAFGEGSGDSESPQDGLSDVGGEEGEPSTDEPRKNMMEMSAGDTASPFDKAGEQETKSRRRMFMFIGGLLFVMMSCCVVTAISWYAMGGMG